MKKFTHSSVNSKKKHFTKKNKHFTKKYNDKNMKEKIIKISKSIKSEKKYMAYIKNMKTGYIRIIHFGASAYEQYKDRTPLKIYTYKNHSNKKRQRNYYSRHSNGIVNRKEAIEYEIKKSNGYYNAKILSHIFLW